MLFIGYISAVAMSLGLLRPTRAIGYSSVDLDIE